MSFNTCLKIRISENRNKVLGVSSGADFIPFLAKKGIEHAEEKNEYGRTLRTYIHTKRQSPVRTNNRL